MSSQYIHMHSILTIMTANCDVMVHAFVICAVYLGTSHREQSRVSLSLNLPLYKKLKLPLRSVHVCMHVYTCMHMSCKPTWCLSRLPSIHYVSICLCVMQYFKSGTKPVTPTIKCKPNPDKTDERGEEGGEVERGEGDGVEGEVMEGGKAATGDGGGGGEVEKGEGDVKGEGEKTPTGVGEGEKAVTTEGERGDCVEKKGGTTGKKAVTELESGVEEAKDRKRKRGRVRVLLLHTLLKYNKFRK